MKESAVQPQEMGKHLRHPGYTNSPSVGSKRGGVAYFEARVKAWHPDRFGKVMDERPEHGTYRKILRLNSEARELYQVKVIV